MIKALLHHLNRRKTLYLGLLLLLVIVLEIAGTMYIPIWREGFFDILQGKLADEYTGILIQFFILMFGLGSIQGIKVWISQLVGVEFRKGFASLWTSIHKGNTPPTSTQAYTESLRQGTEQYITVLTELIISGAIVIALLVVNWHNTVVITAALSYSLLVILITSLFNKPLVNSDQLKQEADGELRELIASNTDSKTVLEKFQNNLIIYCKYIKIQMYFMLYGRLKGSFASFIPYVLLASPYFSGAITFGQFMSQVAIFELIAINLTILVIMYPILTTAKASWKIVINHYNKYKE